MNGVSGSLPTLLMPAGKALIYCCPHVGCEWTYYAASAEADRHNVAYSRHWRIEHDGGDQLGLAV